MKQMCILLFFLSALSFYAQTDTVDSKNYIPCKRTANNVYVVANKKASHHNDSLNKKRSGSTLEKPVWVIMRHTNGKISSEGLFSGECNSPVGLQISYYENGNIRSKTTYAKLTDEKELKKRKKQGYY